MNKTLYIIHGWTYRPEPWEEVIAHLKKDHKITAKLLRVPGLGEPSEKVFTIQDYVKWARQAIPQGSIALGHSNGGRILLNLAADDSDYLKGMILLDAAGVYEPSLKRSVSRFLSKLLSPLKKVKFVRRVAHKLLGASDYEKAPENMKKTLSNMLESDKRLDISRVSTPTAIIWGDADNITPLRQGEKMHQRIANSRMTVKHGWRHSHYLVSANELADAIADALKSLPEQKNA